VISPDLVILAGANGVGKTTFARTNLADFVDQQSFLNADDIAREANPSDVAALQSKLRARCLSDAIGISNRGGRSVSKQRWRLDRSCDSSKMRNVPSTA
jgi:predicted ABC-type ATPase